MDSCLSTSSLLFLFMSLFLIYFLPTPLSICCNILGIRRRRRRERSDKKVKWICSTLLRSKRAGGTIFLCLSSLWRETEREGERGAKRGGGRERKGLLLKVEAAVKKPLSLCLCNSVEMTGKNIEKWKSHSKNSLNTNTSNKKDLFFFKRKMI